MSRRIISNIDSKKRTPGAVVPVKNSAPNNRTIRVTPDEASVLAARIDSVPERSASPDAFADKIFCGDALRVLDALPAKIASLAILDPPYNLTKDYHGNVFRRRGEDAYLAFLHAWLPKVVRVLKDDASIYLCCDWHCTVSCCTALSAYARIRNRITWQREKGRAATDNWKNACEDIWYASLSDSPVFHADAVRVKHAVIAPYRTNGKPKDWQESPEGNFRLTGASNFWNDITVPFWSMPENTDHPTQKPEKLIAKLILASSNPRDIILDPFAGSGTTAVTARKLDRRFISIEQNRDYCCLAIKRLDLVESNPAIQGYDKGVFLERNMKP